MGFIVSESRTLLDLNLHYIVFIRIVIVPYEVLINYILERLDNIPSTLLDMIILVTILLYIFKNIHFKDCSVPKSVHFNFKKICNK